MKNITKSLSLLLCLLFLAQVVPAEERKPFKSRFSLKLIGGGGYAAVGDMNSHLKSIDKNETFEYWRTHDPASISGEVKTLNNWGYDFELELMMKLSRKFSIGIAVSAPIKRSNESTLSFPAREERGVGPQTIKMSYRPEIKLSIPIKLSLYYSWLSKSRLKAAIGAGIGYYPSSISEYYKHTEFPFGSTFLETFSETYDWHAKGRYPFGFHGGIGLEFILNEEFSLVADIQGRYVRIGDLRGEREYRQSDEILKVEGILIYYSRWDGGIDSSYDELDIISTFEEGGDNARKAILDLGGFSMRLGIKVNLY